jgi:predicted RNase H-like HicB family nuclease
MSEIIFVVENADDGGYTAKAIGYCIFTQADSMAELRANVKEAVKCHFEPDELPQIARLHMVKDELMAI